MKVLEQAGPFEPGPDLAKSRIREADLSGEKVLNDGPLPLGGDVASHGLTVSGKRSNVLLSCISSAECAPKKAKNLGTATEIKTVAGDRTLDPKTAKGLLLQYGLYLEKEGYGKNSRYISCVRMLINKGADIYDPENVKETIALQKWKDGVKMQTCYAYDALTKMLKLTWTMPKYRQGEAYPFIPDEKELDALILGSRSKRMSAYLQTLKETMADPTEALRIKWIDMNDNVITINRPVKGHYPRQVEVSNSLISTLNALPKTSELIFPTTYQAIARSYYTMRKTVAFKLNNPRILKISLVTFRHWGATMVYFRTNKILLVKKLLGHKNIQNTMKYTQLVEFKDSDYDVTAATTVEEAKKLGEAGFEKYDEFNGIHLYRKPKRFVSLA
jgi:integrase